MSIHICTYFSFLRVAFQGLVKASQWWALALKWLMAFPAFKFCGNSFFTFWPNKIFSMVSFWSFLSQTFSVSSYFVYQITSKFFSYSFDISAFFSLPPPMLIIDLCPTDIFLLCLEFSHSVTWVLSYSQDAIFSSESLLVIVFKILILN